MAPSTKKTKQAASAAAAPAREEEEQQQVDPLADASLADLEDELTTGPAANWEVAYVFAFLERFTHLVDYDATNPVLPNVMTFEQALIDSSPPASAFAQAAAAAAAATAGASSNPTRTSARLLEETTKQRTMPLTAVAIRNATLSTLNGGNGAAGAEVATSGDKPQQRRSGSPASSLSSLTASESGGDSNAGTTATTTPQDEAAYLAAIQAVETASVPSSLAIDPVPPLLPLEHECPPHSDLLKDIVETFIENLRPIKELSEYHGKKTWFHFLINFVSYRFNADPLYRGGFRWETNLLRTRGLKPGQEKEDKWWKLRWEDKIHLLRQMVDFQLTNAPAVRDLIKEQYDIGHQRNTRRDPSENYLVLPPAGRTSTHVTLFHLDSSPRLYACGNLYKSDSPWIAVSSTLKGYKAFVKTLAEPTSVERVAAGLPTGEAEALLEKEREKQATMMAAKKNKKKAGGLLLAKASGSGKGKGKGTVEVEVGEDRLREERMTRARLEEDLKDMAVYEKHLAALEARRMRASERAARNLSRGFNTPPVATTRSSRLRAREATLRAVNYNENDDGNDDSNINGDNDDADDDDDDDGEGARRKRRRLDDADGNGNGNGNTSSLRSSAAPSVEAEPSTTASTSTTSRRASGGGARQQVPGERRSSRLQQLPAEPSEPDGAELAPVPDTDAGAASVENAPKAKAEVVKRAEEPAVAKEKEEEEEVKPEPGPGPVPTTTTTAAAAAVISGQDGSTIPATPEEPALAFVAKADGAIPPPSSSLPAGAPVEGGGEVAATKEHGAEQQQQQLMEDVQPAPTAEAA